MPIEPPRGWALLHHLRGSGQHLVDDLVHLQGTLQDRLCRLAQKKTAPHRATHLAETQEPSRTGPLPGNANAFRG